MSEELIKFFGGSALFLAAVSWLIRSLITHRLSKDVEDFKSILRHQSQLELQEAGHLLVSIFRNKSVALSIIFGLKLSALCRNSASGENKKAQPRMSLKHGSKLGM